MKSFADWTDEIKALMNPPKCDGNHGVIYKTAYGLRKHMTLEDFRKMYEQEPMTAVEAGTAIHQLVEQALSHGAGRRTGKSWMQNELYRQMLEAAGNTPTTMICDEVAEVSQEAWNDLVVTGHASSQTTFDGDEIKIEYLDPNRLWKL